MLDLPPPSIPPIDVGSAAVEFYAGVAYDAHAETLLDIFVQRAIPNAPLVIYIHGGGFIGGSRNTAYSGQSAEIAKTLSEGYSFATIDYRLLAEVDPDGVRKPLADAARALQFVRYHAEALHLDPARIAVQGGSAGAGTSLWLATHDDLADPISADPIARMSTRVVAAAASNTQSTYDVLRWQEIILDPFGLAIEPFIAEYELEQRMASFYGVTSLADLALPDTVLYRADVDMIGMMSSDDPPIFVESDHASGEPRSEGELLHHPLHAKAVHDHAGAVGIPVTAYIPAYGIATQPAISRWEFLRAALAE